jgi:hypothetical protein
MGKDSKVGACTWASALPTQGEQLRAARRKQP